MTRSILAGKVALALLPLACSAGGGSDALLVGRDGTGGNTGSGGGPIVFHGDGGTTRPLAAHVEQDHVRVELVTLSCAGDCADVEAVATGGNPPYAFAWEDGSTSAARRVCPTASTAYAVTATDTAVTSGEFPRRAETARAEVTANVLACPEDAGSHDAGAPQLDAGPLHPSSCSPVTIPLASCSRSDGVVNLLQGAALTRGVPTALRLTGTANYVASQPWHYELWASKDGCSLDEQLAQFQLQDGPVDSAWCVTASEDYPSVILFYRYAPTDGLSLSSWTASWCGSCGAE